MTELPIIFNDEMVTAALAGRMTQIRFPVKLQPAGSGYVCEETPKYRHNNPNAGRFPGHRWAFNRKDGGFWGVNFDCPFGQVGDLLWVKEAWGSLRMDGRNEPVAVIQSVWLESVKDEPHEIIWQPADEMPRYASRITLELTDVGVQHLDDITCGGYLYQSDIRQSGCPFDNDAALMGADEMEWFKPFWDSAHPDHPWESNPWVWLLNFKLKGGD